MKNYKSLEAHMFFRAGWVQTVMSFKPEGSTHLVLRADVRASQRVNDEPHHPWVVLSKDGDIEAAHCDCMAGLAESCSHVAAVLFKVEAAVRFGYTKTACTDEACKWNKDFVKAIEPEPISKIKFYKDTSVSRAKNRKRNRKKVFQPATPTEQQQLLQALQSCTSKPVALSCFNGYSDEFHWKKISKQNPKLPAPLRSLYSQDVITMSDDDFKSKCEEAINKINVSDDQIKYVYDVTRNQSASITWHEQRTGRITSSNVHAVLHTDHQNPARSVLMNICNPNTKEINSDAIKWGKDHEKDGLRDFSQAMETANPPHSNLILEQTGLLISKEHPFLGASADAVSVCDCHGKKVIEVKCPYSHRDKELSEYLQSADCCMADNMLKRGHKYYSQVQLQMYVHGCSQCAFVIWTPKFTIVTFVQRDEEFITDMVVRTKSFFVNSVIPELLTRKVEQTKAKVSRNIKPNQRDEKLYCICQAPDDGRDTMIGCDNPNCKYMWYHLSCLKLKRAPKGNWLCRRCRKEKRTKEQ